MWKKLGIVALAWLGTLSAVYGYGYYMKHLQAASNLNYGGNVSGRVHTAPTNLSGPKDTIGMKKEIASTQAATMGQRLGGS